MKNAGTVTVSVGVMTEEEKKHKSSYEEAESKLKDELEYHRIRHTTKDMGL